MGGMMPNHTEEDSLLLLSPLFQKLTQNMGSFPKVV